jgi:hypothetical protein
MALVPLFNEHLLNPIKFKLFSYRRTQIISETFLKTKKEIEIVQERSSLFMFQNVFI